MRKTGKSKMKMKKRLFALILSGIFLFGIWGSKIQAEAATDSEILNAIVPIICGYNENGEVVSVSLGMPVYTEELGVIIVSSEAYLGTCSTYVMVFFTGIDTIAEIITPFAASEEYKVVFFCLQSDSEFIASFPIGSIGNVTTDTALVNALLLSDLELEQALNYCVGKEGNFYKLAYSLEGIIGGSVVFNSEDSTAVGMVVDEGDGTYFVDIDTIGALYQMAINETTGGQGTGGGGTGGSGTGGGGTGGTGSGGGGAGGSGTGGGGTGGSGTGGGGTGGSGAGGGGTGGLGAGGIWGFIVLGIVIVLVFLLYSYSKKNKGSGKKSEYEPAVLSDGISLMGISGVHAGAVFPLDELLVLGRDKNRCNLIFAGDTQGISSVHCQIKPVGSGVELMDLGSSYGTFLQDGMRLTPHTPYVLRKGDGFYLADRQYSYRVQ